MRHAEPRKRHAELRSKWARTSSPPPWLPPSSNSDENGLPHALVGVGITPAKPKIKPPIHNLSPPVPSCIFMLFMAQASSFPKTDPDKAEKTCKK